ncbi:MAG: phenylalanine--tRNA ligase subunit beta [Clostridia bacterium]|nr:phenylalanine--tRNA ligase subunit beta [Clostridia bacterium]
MIVSLNWLKDYTDVKVSAEEFCDRMIMSGSNLETLTYQGVDIENVVVARIDKIDKHPDADKLVVCQLYIGDKEANGKDEETGLIQIVTGANNVKVGDLVPVALHNSKVPGPLHGQAKVEGGVKITKGKLRGVPSFGMMCGPQELGIEDKCVPVDSKDGIWLLNGEFTPGTPLVEALGLEDAIIDFEITPNRPDCLSMIGMAREAAATFGTELRYPETKCTKESADKLEDYISVEVKSDLCKRYTARVIKDVKIGPSPWWLQKRLMAAGQRPINNIVDITNFVMLEYGQPLHAFDIRELAGNKIVVKTAEDGDKFTTLDEVERTLTKDMLTICDGEKAVALAGVMGGLNSEIKEDTEMMVLESANFDANSVRLTSKALTLRTEASSRYEKGIDPNLCEEAADRFCYLVESLGAGTVCQGSIDIYPEPVEVEAVHARVSRINHVLGMDLSREEMVDFLERLEMEVTGSGDDLYVKAPSVRQDIEIEEDIVEEVARLYGYDNLPTTLPKGNKEAGEPAERTLRDKARDVLCAMGLDEIITYSFVSPKGVDKVRIDEDSWERAFVKILNPLGEDTSVMRTILTPNMMEVLAHNYSHNISEMKAYEIGNCFMANYMDPNGLPDEGYNICIGSYGDGMNFFELKGIVCELLEAMGIKNLRFEAESEYGVYHPGRCARVLTKHVVETEKGPREEEVELGIMGEVHPEVQGNYGIKTRVYLAELMFDNIMEVSDTEIHFMPIPKYPAVERDIALVVEEAIEAAQIIDTIKEAANDILRKVEMFDVYRGEQVGEGLKSIAFKLTYRDNDKTLTDDEVVSVHNNILKALEEKLDAKLREM